MSDNNPHNDLLTSLLLTQADLRRQRKALVEAQRRVYAAETRLAAAQAALTHYVETSPVFTRSQVADLVGA